MDRIRRILILVSVPLVFLALANCKEITKEQQAILLPYFDKQSISECFKKIDKIAYHVDVKGTLYEEPDVHSAWSYIRHLSIDPVRINIDRLPVFEPQSIPGYEKKYDIITESSKDINVDRNRQNMSDWLLYGHFECGGYKSAVIFLIESYGHPLETSTHQ